MNATEYRDRSLDRLLAINWRFAEPGLPSHIALVREYLRRSALWADCLRVTDQWPFFDVAYFIAPKVRTDDDRIAELERVWNSLPIWPTIKKTCIWYLHWENLKHNSPELIAQYNLPDPFEPLIRLYERGGSFYTEHGFINIGLVGIPAKTQGWQTYFSITALPELDDAALDLIDSSSHSA